MSPEATALSHASDKLEKKKFLITAINGTALYVLAYYIITAIHQFSKISLSHYFLLRGTWDPSRIIYAMADREWWRLAIISVYGIGPLVCLIIGLIAYQVYWSRLRAKRGLIKLLMLWVAFHGFNAFFGALLADTFTQTGFWYVSSWLFELGNVINVLLAFIAGLIQIGVGYVVSAAFLQAHDSKTVMKYQRRQRMVVHTLILPWLAGSVCIILAKIPYVDVQEMLRLFMMGLLITPTALGCLNELFESTVRKPQPTHFSWGLIGLAVLFATIWYMALSPPVSFG